ncbi:MAG TPA: hypothetical protein VNU26_17470 [Mycobacteriales bacterium]|nr:hypothetical protein [Mycobacteriales bacterium]
MRHRAGALLVVLVTGLVASAMAVTGVSLLRTGDPVQMGVGVGVLLLVVVGAVLVVGEVRLAAASERLGRRLAGEGGLPEDVPERRPSGRLPRAAADRQFALRKAETEASPDDWRAWFRLALAYSDARDSSAGRRAMRRAVALERADRANPRDAADEDRS